MKDIFLPFERILKKNDCTINDSQKILVSNILKRLGIFINNINDKSFVLIESFKRKNSERKYRELCQKPPEKTKYY
jgi:hypothetical protein